MKNTIFSRIFLLSFRFCLPNINEAAIPYTIADAKATACLGFATSKASNPTPTCCTGLQDLAKTVKTVDDKKAICKCLKAAEGFLGVKDLFLSKIPGACNIKVGFPVFTSINCDAIR